MGLTTRRILMKITIKIPDEIIKQYRDSDRMSLRCSLSDHQVEEVIVDTIYSPYYECLDFEVEEEN